MNSNSYTLEASAHKSDRVDTTTRSNGSAGVNDSANDSKIHLSVDYATPKKPPLKSFNSVILANTGDRVQRSWSFLSDSSTGEQEPLLGNRSSVTIGQKFESLYGNEVFRNVLKCSIGYLLASLGVYWMKFDSILGKSDSKHIIATVAVYFHPSRTKGSMYQCLLFVIISLVFSFSVSFGCRAVSTYFFNKGMDEVSYIIDLVVSSIALGIIAFMKQKVNKPTFNVACSLASISVVACIVKEGSLNSSKIPIERLQSTLQVVVAGCVISVSVCYTLWPQSAVGKLRRTLNESYDLMSSATSLVVNKFLSEDGMNSANAEIFKSIKNNIKKLYSNLEEAEYELKFKGREKEWDVFRKLVETTDSLAKHLQALRSSTEMRWNLLNENDESSSSISSLTSEYTPLSQSVENMDRIASEETEVDYAANNSKQLFEMFVHCLSPSIKSFVFTLKGILNKIPFEDENNPKKFTDTEQFQQSLQSAIDLYDAKQKSSFGMLYSQSIFQTKSFDFKADHEEVAACCGNFLSLLGLFGANLMLFLKFSEEYDVVRSQPRSWKWLKFWNRRKSNQETGAKWNDALLDLQTQFKSKSRNHDEGFSYKLWSSLQVLRRTDVQFGIRVGLGAFFLSSFAFIHKTRNIFTTWRGEWTLAIYCIMMNKSLGGTTSTVKWRFVGTFLGAYGAFFVWYFTDGNVYALATTGFLISIPSFYIIMYWKSNNPFGRFILLTYNLTALYSYSMTEKDGEDNYEGGDSPIVGEIAFHRFISVSVGIVWALTMAALFLPNSARKRLKKGLTVIWLRLGVVWSSDPLDYDPDSKILTGLKDKKGLNSILSECDTLVKQAPLEFRLKGKFPSSTYSKLVECTSTIIDAFQNIDLMIQVDPRINENEEHVLQYIKLERAEIEHRIFSIFYTIASAMSLGFPLPSKPASTEHAKDTMLIKLNEIRLNNSSKISLTNEDYVLFYSYILVTSIITEQLDIISNLISDLFGDISEEVLQLA